MALDEQGGADRSEHVATGLSRRERLQSKVDGWLERPGARGIAGAVFFWVIWYSSETVLGIQDLFSGTMGSVGVVLAVVFGSFAYRSGARAVRLVQVAGVLAVLAFTLAVAARTVESTRLPAAGTIAFGLEASDCIVQDPRDTFEASQAVYQTANLSRPLAVGETYTTRYTIAGVELPPMETTSQSRADYLCLDSPVTVWMPGTYAFEYRVGDEVLASGSYEVVEPAD